MSFITIVFRLTNSLLASQGTRWFGVFLKCSQALTFTSRCLFCQRNRDTNAFIVTQNVTVTPLTQVSMTGNQKKCNTEIKLD